MVDQTLASNTEIFKGHINWSRQIYFSSMSAAACSYIFLNFIFFKERHLVHILFVFSTDV